MSVVVRPAHGGDADAVRQVGLDAWPETYAFAGATFVAEGLERWWSPEAVRRGLATTTTLVAEVDGEVVGTGNRDVRGDVPVIWKLYVRPEHQGRGVGGALLRSLLDLHPDEPLELEHVDGNERAAALYARHGFTEVRREPVPGHPAAWPVSVWLRCAARRG